ncbi:MAG: DUF952 domain-containing protein [Phenylobacterium sp.]|nr:DUF952 domain-containing protein [Phenylobacterium sp.]MDD3838662.1 DUF952 domain-containing protein [Phenylobacterium sp.]MDX9997182.1 DUF952 domain-containing protein [Phenylobacterium sp.]
MMRVYKILAEAEWRAALAAGRYEGSAVDRKDGFIHLSTAAQAPETARRHFAGQPGLVIAAFEADDLGAALKWEPSRGGDLFPHAYGALDPSRALWTRSAPLGEDGVPVLGDLS